jgi:hypothetical protein
MVARFALADAEKGDKKMKMAACGLDCNTCDTRPKGCGGCHGPDDKVWSGDCKIRVCCIKQKKLSDCSECDQFPCEHIKAFENDKWPHHRKAVAGLRKIREDRKTATPPL